jgi:serine/threonine protein kinase
MVLKYLTDMCKGLSSLHNCGIIHGNIRPSKMYLSSDNVLMLGELGRVKLDHNRQTHKLFSKVLI